MEKIIYYFSGTGNSLRAAQIIAAEIGGAKLISMRNDPENVSARTAEMIGFVCPVYEWDVPKTVKAFVNRLMINPRAYTFMVVTYIAIHGRCFETINTALQKKGSYLYYGKTLRCVASQYITISDKRPVWNHSCEGCNACVVYCPTKAIQFKTPDAYIRLDNIITRKLGLPENRTRYHNPYITAADLMKSGEDILAPK